jgi:hypothetical protein
MDRRRSAAVGAVLLLALVAVGGYVLYPPLSVALFGPPTEYGETTVTAYDADGERLGSVEARVADDRVERYAGLSHTDSLGDDEGMWFVHGGVDERTYVMRGMSFGIDIVFVAPNGTVTTVHHAEAPGEGVNGESLRYEGTGRYVLELPYEWTTRNGLGVGDCVEADGYGTTCGS